MTPYSRSPQAPSETPSDGTPLVTTLSAYVLPRLLGVVAMVGGAAYFAPRGDELERPFQDNITVRHENHVRVDLAEIEILGDHLFLTTMDGAHLSVPQRDVIFSSTSDGPEKVAVIFDKKRYRWPSEAELIMSKGRAAEEDLGVVGQGIFLSISYDAYLELLPKLSDK